jgi:hypothetical protein
MKEWKDALGFSLQRKKKLLSAFSFSLSAKKMKTMKE